MELVGRRLIDAAFFLCRSARNGSSAARKMIERKPRSASRAQTLQSLLQNIVLSSVDFGRGLGQRNSIRCGFPSTRSPHRKRTPVRLRSASIVDKASPRESGPPVASVK